MLPILFFILSKVRSKTPYNPLRLGTHIALLQLFQKCLIMCADALRLFNCMYFLQLFQKCLIMYADALTLILSIFSN